MTNTPNPNAVVAEMSARLKKNRRDAIALIERASAYLQLRNGEGALADAEQALRLLQGQPLPDGEMQASVLCHLYKLKARALGGLGRNQEAMKAADQALVALPGDGEAFKIRGRVRRSLGDAAGGAEDYERVLQSQPNDPDKLLLLQNLVDYYATTGQWHKALDAINRLASERDTAGVLIMRAQIHSSLGNTGEAINDLRRASELDPTDPDPLFNLALVYYHANAIPAAIETLRAFLRVMPNDGEAQAFLQRLIEQGK